MDYPSNPNVGLVGGKFSDGDASQAIKGSLDPAAWANALTDEVLAVIVAGGLTPDEDVFTQLRDAINALIASALAGGSNAVLNAGGTPSIQTGLLSSRPAAGTAGRLYIASDIKQWYRDTGSAWVQFGTVDGAITANGYIKFATNSGVTLIIQWVTISPLPGNSVTTVALPISFTGATFGAVVAPSLTLDGGMDLSGSATLSQVSVNNPRNISPAIASAFVIVFGF